MKFCSKCGSLIMPKKDGEKVIYACSCGNVESGKETKIVSQTKTKEVEKISAQKEDEDNRLPICEMECEKCGYKKCYFWEIQTRAGDEPPTRFYKCVSCKYTWREYS
jgi:transcription factor S